MTAVLDSPKTTAPPITSRSSSAPPGRAAVPAHWLRRPRWNRFTVLQLLIMTLATIAPTVVAGAITAGLLGAISLDTMMEVALAAGENPGTVTFGAMFLASPVQWATGRSQVRVRKYLGIVFFLLALSNGAMFVLDSGLTATLGTPSLIAGSLAVALAAPLFLTSSRRSQRMMGMRRWRLLHKLTYVIAAALLGHLLLIPELGPGALLITLGFLCRLPLVRRSLTKRR